MPKQKKMLSTETGCVETRLFLDRRQKAMENHWNGLEGPLPASTFGNKMPKLVGNLTEGCRFGPKNPSRQTLVSPIFRSSGRYHLWRIDVSEHVFSGTNLQTLLLDLFFRAGEKPSRYSQQINCEDPSWSRIFSPEKPHFELHQMSGYP